MFAVHRGHPHWLDRAPSPDMCSHSLMCFSLRNSSVIHLHEDPLLSENLYIASTRLYLRQRVGRPSLSLWTHYCFRQEFSTFSKIWGTLLETVSHLWSGLQTEPAVVHVYVNLAGPQYSDLWSSAILGAFLRMLPHKTKI